MTNRQQAWQARRDEYEQKQQQQRAAVIAEFGGDTDAMAAEILRCRRVMRQLADAIAWGAGWSAIRNDCPDPYWQSQPPCSTPDLNDVRSSSD